MSTLEQNSYSSDVQKSSNVNSNDEKLSFPDIKNHWCKDVIEKFVSKKWVAGYDDGLFRPDNYVTRAEFTAMVSNIFKKEK
ncbi:MAG: S-layer homology domain-containing protein [Clostridium sp.]|nr:S-layer homology domain-containing protein [Clostridium sp.]